MSLFELKCKYKDDLDSRIENALNAANTTYEQIAKNMLEWLTTNHESVVNTWNPVDLPKLPDDIDKVANGFGRPDALGFKIKKRVLYTYRYVWREGETMPSRPDCIWMLARILRDSVKSHIGYNVLVG